MNATRRICALCGRVFTILIPPGAEPAKRDKLCGECATLPEPPSAPDTP